MMSDRHDKQKLSADFAQLRREERAVVPGFQTLITATEADREQPVFGRKLAYALSATAILALTLLFLLDIQNPNVPVGPTTVSGAEYSGLKLEVAYEMPTDFLLETPWFPLEHSTPNFEFTIPDYEYREE